MWNWFTQFVRFLSPNPTISGWFRAQQLSRRCVNPFTIEACRNPSTFFHLLISSVEKGCMQGQKANKRKKEISPLNYFYVKSLIINLIIYLPLLSVSLTYSLCGNIFNIALNQFYGPGLEKHQRRHHVKGDEIQTSPRR